MPLDLTNLQSAIQARVDALGASSDEKTLLLLSKAIEAAVGNVAVSEIVNATADGLADIEGKRIAEVQAVLDTAAARIAAINAMDAVLKSGSTMTGSLTAPQVSSAAYLAEGPAPLYIWKETDAGTDSKQWDAVAIAGALLFRATNDLYSNARTWMEVARNGVSAVWVLFTTAVRAKLTTVTAASNTFTVDANLGNEFDLGTLTAASTLANIANPPAAGSVQSIAVRWTQDATGGRTMSFGANCVNVGGTTPNNAANKVNFAVGKIYPDGKFYYSIARGA